MEYDNHYFGHYDSSMKLEPYGGSEIILPRFTRVNPPPPDTRVYSVYDFPAYAGKGPPYVKSRRKSSRDRMLHVTCTLLVLALIALAICVVFLAIGAVDENSAESDAQRVGTRLAWSPWGGWAGCSATCGAGTKYRHRMCYLATIEDTGHQDSEGSCTESGLLESETSACTLQSCVQRRVVPIPEDFAPHQVSTEYLYTCADSSHSIDIGSGNGTCPIAHWNHVDSSWNVVNATCSKVRNENNIPEQYGGTIYATSGYITSADHPRPYPDREDLYLWTLAAGVERGIEFELLTLYTDSLSGSCDNRTSVSVYCGVNIADDNPSWGPLCGHLTSRPTFYCDSPCAIVKFSTVPRINLNASGFHLTWTTDVIV